MSAAQTPGEATPAPGAVSGQAGPLTASNPINNPDTPAGQLGIAFKRAMAAIRRLRGRETHRPGQLSYAQYSLLFGLSGMCERSARELADHADLTPASVTQMLEHLEAAGLVKRTRSEQDRRVVLSTLTERGAEVVAERHAQMEPRWRAILSEFSDQELLAAARVVGRLADYFNSLDEGPVE
ncbi:MAG TPA: MarR family winged helix-turn-helix transcriptional regulator [Solirubrobacteraceae bacterium]|nr:MarR family winged helix-turn-helix transcriptional regulator [Solirubrobacteraceae bacterium]